MGGECSQYGDARALLLQLELTYEDGTKEYVTSDKNFQCSNDGVIRYSDIFIGEKQDLRKSETLENISQPTFDTGTWAPVVLSSNVTDNMIPQMGAPVRKMKEFRPIAILMTPEKETVIDFGQVFAPTACFNLDMNAFFTRWMQSVILDQTEDGQFPIVVPFSQSYQNVTRMQGQGNVTAAGWSEAGILVPYTMYKMCGDKNILTRCYPSMQKWMQFMEGITTKHNSKDFDKKKSKTQEEIERRKYIWDTGWQYGDWMAPSISKGTMGGVSGAKITPDLQGSYVQALCVWLRHGLDLPKHRRHPARETWI